MPDPERDTFNEVSEEILDGGRRRPDRKKRNCNDPLEGSRYSG